MNQKHYKNHNKKANRLLELLIRQEKLEKVMPRIKKTSLWLRGFLIGFIKYLNNNNKGIKWKKNIK